MRHLGLGGSAGTRGAPHSAAYSLGPQPLEQWVKQLPPDVAFRRVPAAFNSVWESYARTYYALEATGQLDALHKRLFAALHVQRQRLEVVKEFALNRPLLVALPDGRADDVGTRRGDRLT